MSRVLTVREMKKFVTSIPRKNYVWHDFNPKKKYSAQGFCVVVRDNSFHGSIHITAQGEIHGFNQNGRKNEIMHWSKRYKFNSVSELQKIYKTLERRLIKTKTTRF